MTVRIIPLDAMGVLPAGRLEAAVAALDRASHEVAPPLGADRVDVMVHASERLIPGWDLNGYALNAGLVMIGLSTKPKLTAELAHRPEARSLASQLRSVLAHELHHAMRSRGPGYGKSLGEALVSEGLAQCFEEEVGCPTPNYALAVRGELLGLAAMRARKDWDSTEFAHERWFYGDRLDETWPWSGGYSLGYALVRRYLDESGLTASGAVTVSAAAIRPRVDAALDELVAAIPTEEAA